jgi:DNA-binding transcriptional ArsR family regulator
VARTLPEPTADSLDLTTILEALAHPVRRRLMSELYRSFPEALDCSTRNLPGEVGIGAPTVSHHFRVLREAGLTRTVVDGRTHRIQVRRDEVEAAYPGLLDATLGRD